MGSRDVDGWKSVTVTGVARTTSENSSLMAYSAETTAMTLSPSYCWWLLMRRKNPSFYKLDVRVVPEEGSCLSMEANSGYVGMLFLDPKMDSSGLWSVNRVKCWPWRNLWNLLTANTKVSASFSI